MRTFLLPLCAALAAFAFAYTWGGAHALFLVVLLAILETTLSFDNAVVNAKILTRMDALWQKRFLAWGIPVAVFGTRFILPVVIVSAAAGLSPLFTLELALFEPVRYGGYLSSAHAAIASFGSAFLLLVSLKYFFNDRKTVHWIEVVERHLSRWGGIEALEVALVLSALLASALFLPHEAATILSAGIIGVVLFIVMEGIAQSFETETTGSVAGAALFAYLNVLDAAFSLDGVIGAFAVTTSLPVIIIGLGLGALFVRAFTVALVRARTLDALVYLEHGAHWAIFGLALAMLAGLFVRVPEMLTGGIGLLFITLAYLSSRKNAKTAAH